MRKLFIISGIMFSFLTVQNAKAQYVSSDAQAAEYQTLSQENANPVKKSAAKEKMKAEKPKFKDFLKESGNEAGLDNAYSQKERIVVEEFYKDGSVPEKFAEEVRNYLISAIQKRDRLEIINPFSVRMNGRDYTKTEYFGNGKFKDNDRFDALMNAGVRFVISGKITDYDTNEYHNAKGKMFHESTITVCFTAYDLRTRTVLRTYNKIAAVHGFNSNAKANEKLLDVFNDKYESFLDKSFKLRTTLKEVNQATKDGVMKSCLINAGSSLGVAANDNFDVYVETIGKSGSDYKKLGRVKATKNIYSGFSECNVNSGAKKISGALEAGAELIFLSDDNSIIF